MGRVSKQRTKRIPVSTATHSMSSHEREPGTVYLAINTYQALPSHKHVPGTVNDVTKATTRAALPPGTVCTACTYCTLYSA